MPRLRHILLKLGVVLTIAGVLTLSGCSSSDEQAVKNNVNNRAFTFQSGTVFDPALTDVTTLQFANNATVFTLSSAGDCPNGVCMASGSNFFGSCILTVFISSYEPGTGPQVNDVITLQPCNFDSTHHTLTVSNGPITATSDPAIARLVVATPNDLNNRNFQFGSGQVFDAGLTNVAVTLAFSNNASAFTLTTITNTNLQASGFVIFGLDPLGLCILTVTASKYLIGFGPQINEVISLSPCQYNSATVALSISNGTVSITSGQ